MEYSEIRVAVPHEMHNEIRLIMSGNKNADNRCLAGVA